MSNDNQKIIGSFNSRTPTPTTNTSDNRNNSSNQQQSSNNSSNNNQPTKQQPNNAEINNANSQVPETTTSTTINNNNSNQKMPLSRSLTQPQGTIEYVVAANDTITSVAARFHTTPSELARINRRTGHFIFPGQVLFVPKSNHLSSLSVENVTEGNFGQQRQHSVPPNTPNDPSSKSPSRGITSTSTTSSSLSDNPSFGDNQPNNNQSPSAVPGHAERIPSVSGSIVQGSIDNVFVISSQSSPSSSTDHHQQHHPSLIHTISEPVQVTVTSMPMANINAKPTPATNMTTTSSIDPADRECLERFLKINVRYITDGQGVVSGVLLVTPNALMFDSNVSDPLVMEHGSEMYNVTVPIELVLKTALYSDIAHMRVKHAPEAVPSVPKPSVYYASDEDTSGIVEENLKNAYAKKKTAFDTIGKVSEEQLDSQSDEKTEEKSSLEKTNGGDDEEFKDAMEHHRESPSKAKTIDRKPPPPTPSNTICDDVNDNEQQPRTSESKPEQHPKDNDKVRQKDGDETQIPVSTEQSLQSLALNDQQQHRNLHQESTEVQIDEDELLVDVDDDESSKFYADDSQKRSSKVGGASAGRCPMEESLDMDDQTTSIDQSLDLMTSMDDPDLINSTSFSTPPSSSAIDYHMQQQQQQSNQTQPQNRKPMPHLVKVSLGERHSAPLQANHSNHTNNRSVDEHKPLQSAISAEETCSDPILRPNRLSAAGENRRGQMLKRLSNPVDAIGNLTKSGISSSINATKSGFNATKTGISKGLNATQTGISSGYHATKSGLTTGLSVTKTGFNKVLATPKNLMDFSSGLVRDAKGAFVPTGSKSDMNLQEHLEGDNEQTGSTPPQKNRSPMLGYCNMVDTKIDAFENFDKLIPRPARVNKDAPLYLCIRMGKYCKNDAKRNQRYSPTYSFGKNRYEREYWFSVPKDKAKNLYHFFKKWAPEIYGDVDDISGCEQRGLEPINTDDEFELDDDDVVDADIALMAGGRPSNLPSHNATTNDDSQNSLSLNDPNKMNAASNNRQRFWRRSPLHFLKLVEDHFSTDGLSTEWNVSNSSEEHSFAERYGLDANSTEPILPDLLGKSELLNVEIIQNLSKHLPARAEGYAWTLIYSTSQHGFSLNTLYRDMRHFDSPVLLIIEDTNSAKFGALLSHSLRLSDHFYGTGETFLFSFHPTFECFPWTGENIFFIKGNVDSISIGAGEGNFGLWLDGDLYHGSSHPCKTFGNRTLSSEEDFVVKSIECWGFV